MLPPYKMLILLFWDLYYWSPEEIWVPNLFHKLMRSITNKMWVN